MKHLESFDSWALLEKDRSVINYYGSKYSLIDSLQQHFPDRAPLFIDLFCGGANVAINVNYPKKIANDINPNLISLFVYIQRTSLPKIIKKIDSLVLEYGLNKPNPNGYAKLKIDHFKDKDPAKLYVLTVSSYFGVMRFNKKGGFNKGYAHAAFNKKLIYGKLKIFKGLIKNIKFINKHFSKISPPKKAFVYADPPYLITNADYNLNWSKKDEIKLLEYLDKLNDKGIKFALSNVLTHSGKSNDLLIEWAKSYTVINMDKKYSLAKSEVKNTQEVLIINY